VGVIRGGWMATEVTVGIDIGTTSVKAIAADGDGLVVSSSRVPHPLRAAHAGELAHDARVAWRDGVRAALAGVLASEDLTVRGVDVAAMVPSLCAVDAQGVPVSDGMLYGDARGAGGDLEADPSQSGELARFLAWLVDAHPEAAGYWPAQAVANAALSGEGAMDATVAMTAVPLFDYRDWDAAVAGAAGLTDLAKLPRVVTGADAVGKVEAAAGAPLGGGTIDALGEQLVAGADQDGDVLVILGSTLIVWAVIPEWRTEDGLWTVPHTAPGKVLIGGPSNAGGLFLNWVDRLLGDRGPVAQATSRALADVGARTSPPGTLPDDASRVPVWQPYLRGERVPYHDPMRRASLHDLDIGLDARAVRRAAYEASGFATRHMLDLGRVDAKRIVATGGGVRDAAWVQALADATGVPVDVVAVPEGGALGAAWLARVTAGLEPLGSSADAWVRTGARVEPDPRARDAIAQRYARYRGLAG
jgi:xylulokinase